MINRQNHLKMFICLLPPVSSGLSEFILKSTDFHNLDLEFKRKEEDLPY